MFIRDCLFERNLWKKNKKLFVFFFSFDYILVAVMCRVISRQNRFGLVCVFECNISHTDSQIRHWISLNLTLNVCFEWSFVTLWDCVLMSGCHIHCKIATVCLQHIDISCLSVVVVFFFFLFRCIDAFSLRWYAMFFKMCETVLFHFFYERCGNKKEREEVWKKKLNERPTHI